MTEFTPILSLFGGALIGLSAVLLMAFHGRIAGMTGIVSGLLHPRDGNLPWRAAFLGGAIVAPLALMPFIGATELSVPFASPVPTPFLVLGGLIVGAGVYFGAGCTSGHGVCGIARLSPRSLVATATFMAFALLTVFLIRHVMGGS